MKKLTLGLLTTVFIVVMGGRAFALDGITVQGAASPAILEEDSIQHQLRGDGAAGVFEKVDLGGVDARTIQNLSENISVPKQIGVNRNIVSLSSVEKTSSRLSWQKLPDSSHYSGMVITSPGARSLRVGMKVVSLPESAELRFFSIQKGEPVDIHYIPASEILETLRINRAADPDDPHGEIFWSPTVTGETIGIEIYLPKNIMPSSVRVFFPRLSHIAVSLHSSQGLDILFQGYGDANPCQNDVSCADSTWTNLRNAVAAMQFTTPGGTFICTGTLLNDLDTQSFIPYFITANHCINSQPVASTLETHWFWQSDSCNSATLSPFYKKITGGATLLHTLGMSTGPPTGTSMDTTLLRLNSSPPPGAYFAGWTTGVPPGAGTARVGIHHPMGDWKKITFGTYETEAACGAADGGSFTCYSGSGNFYVVRNSDGGTQPGSSGSSFYSDNNPYVIGTLSGGVDGDCAGSSSIYSSFRAAYAAGNYGIWLYSLPNSPSPGSSDFYWPLFLPAITGGGCSKGPFWTAYNLVCCRSSSATFSVTVAGKTKQSTASSCSVASTWNGWAESEAGTKTVYWKLTSRTCGSISGRFTWDMEKGKVYLFQLEFVNGRPILYVYSGNACEVIENMQTTKALPFSKDSSAKGEKVLQRVDEIKLELPSDLLKANSASPWNSLRQQGEKSQPVATPRQ